MTSNTVVGRVSATSMTARWSSRVGSTEHPESRSYLSENSEGMGPLQDRESSINQPRGTGLFAKLQNTERPTWRTTEYSHPQRSSNGTSCNRARPVRNPSRWLPRSRQSKCTIFRFPNFPTCTVLSQWKKHRNELKHLTGDLFIMGGRGEHARSRVIRL